MAKLPYMMDPDFEIQQQYLKEVEKTNPKLLQVTDPYSEEKVLPEIGIEVLPENRSEGFLKYSPLDFIVEEVGQNGTISSVVKNDQPPEETAKTKISLFCDLVKIGVGTVDIVHRLNKVSSVPFQDINYAGVKDARALTSQRLSLKNIKYDQVKDLKAEEYFLTNFKYQKGVMQRGNLRGNVFTILIRTNNVPKAQEIKERLVKVQENGFLNFFQTQRFGAPRYLNRKIGKEIFKGNYEQAIKIFLTTTGQFDITLLKQLRQQAADHYGSWQKMTAVMQKMPHTFRHELRILRYLEKQPRDFIGALSEVQDQATFWIYAYPSYLFNKVLSEATKENIELPGEMPLLLTEDMTDRKLYSTFLAEDEIDITLQTLRPFKFIWIKKQYVPTRVMIQDLKYQITNQGLIISFFLPKGAYATTLLSELFKLKEGRVIPDWVKTEQVDIKKELKTGSVEPAREIIDNYFKHQSNN